jgi:hypothetical protein
VTQREVLAGLVGVVIALMVVKGGLVLKAAIKTPTPTTTEPQVKPTPCPTVDTKGSVWQQRTRCFEYEDYMAKHGDYPPQVYDFINDKDMAAINISNPCDTQDRTSIIEQGCVSYWERVNLKATPVKWTVKVKLKTDIFSVQWITRDVSVLAIDEYLAREKAYSMARENRGVVDAIIVSVKKEK